MGKQSLSIHVARQHALLLMEGSPRGASRPKLVHIYGTFKNVYPQCGWGQLVCAGLGDAQQRVCTTSVVCQAPTPDAPAPQTCGGRNTHALYLFLRAFSSTTAWRLRVSRRVWSRAACGLSGKTEQRPTDQAEHWPRSAQARSLGVMARLVATEV